jgi:hypothetical protein
MRAVAIILTLAALGWACGPGPARCNFALDCPDDGQVYTCNDRNQCETIVCETSGECPIGAHCGLFLAEEEELATVLAEGRLDTCLDGCERNDDCMVGFRCDAGECVETPCRNGHLDCGFCELCDDGTCVPAGDPFCLRCTAEYNVIDQGDPADPCDSQLIGHFYPDDKDPFQLLGAECGAGNGCWDYNDERTCAVRCESNSACPGGMVCTDYFVVNASCPLGISSLGRFCLGDCRGAAVCRGEADE